MDTTTADQEHSYSSKTIKIEVLSDDDKGNDVTAARNGFHNTSDQSSTSKEDNVSASGLDKKGEGHSQVKDKLVAMRSLVKVEKLTTEVSPNLGQVGDEVFNMNTTPLEGEGTPNGMDNKEMLVISRDVKQALDSVAQRLSLGLEETLLFLCAHYKRTTTTNIVKDEVARIQPGNNDQEVMSELGGVVRRALRDELTSLLGVGLIPQGIFHIPDYLHASHPIHKASESPGERDVREVRTRPASDQGKRRSRKSLPQRLVVGGAVCEPITLLNSSDDVDDMDDTNNMTLDTSEMSRSELMNFEEGTSSSTGITDNDVSSFSVEPQSPWKQEVFAIAGHLVLRQDGFLACPFCKYKSQVLTRLKRHVTLHTGKDYKCDQCDKSYTEVYKLKEHIQVKHEKSLRYDCEYCPRVFTSKGGLKYHLNTSHNTEFEFWCDICSKGFHSKDAYDEHRLVHSGSTLYQCQNCEKNFSYQAAFISHTKECPGHSSSGIHGDEVDDGSVGFTNNKQLTMKQNETLFNIYIDEDIEEYTCTCGISFNKYKLLLGHQESCSFMDDSQPIKEEVEEDEEEEKALHDGDPDFDPGSAGKSRSLLSRSEHNLRNSSQSGEGPVREKCIFPKKSNKGIPHQCEYCSYKTIKKSHLTRHIMTHTGKKHKCEQCSGSFNEMNKLRLHMKLKHDINLPKGPIVRIKAPNVVGSKQVLGVHYCTKCNYSTAKPSHMKRHQMVHYGKEHQCMICLKSFNEINKVVEHVHTVHEGVSPFKCYDCNKTFKSKPGLHYHMETKHKKDFKYQCEVCDKKFNRLQHFLGHKNTHSGERPHVCNKCGRGFSYQSVLLVHQSRCQGNKGQVDEKTMTCGLCGTDFDTEKAFDDHSCVDDSEVFACNCGEAFIDETVFQSHRKLCPSIPMEGKLEESEESRKESPGRSARKTQPPLVLNQPVFPTLTKGKSS